MRANRRRHDAQPYAAAGLRAAGIEPGEAMQDLLSLRFGHTGPFIRDAQNDVLFGGFHRHQDAPTLRRILDRVVEKVRNHAGKQRARAGQLRRCGMHLQTQSALLRQRLVELDRFGDDRIEPQRRKASLRNRLGTRKFEDIPDQPQDGVEILAAFRHHRMQLLGVGLLHLGQFEPCPDARDRRAQIVRQPFGRGAKRPDQPLDLLEGRIEGAREPVVFVAPGGHRQALVQLAAQEPVAGIGCRLHEEEAAAAVPEAERQTENAGREERPDQRGKIAIAQHHSLVGQIPDQQAIAVRQDDRTRLHISLAQGGAAAGDPRFEPMIAWPVHFSRPFDEISGQRSAARCRQQIEEFVEPRCAAFLLDGPCNPLQSRRPVARKEAGGLVVDEGMIALLEQAHGLRELDRQREPRRGECDQRDPDRAAQGRTVEQGGAIRGHRGDSPRRGRC